MTSRRHARPRGLRRRPTPTAARDELRGARRARRRASSRAPRRGDHRVGGRRPSASGSASPPRWPTRCSRTWPRRVAPGRRRGVPRHRLPLRRDARHPRRGRGDAAGQPASTSRPSRRVAEQDAEYGQDLFDRDPDLCCALRKVEPLERALAGVRRLGHRAAPRRDADPGERARSSAGTTSKRQGQGLPARPLDRRTTSTPTSPSTTCWSTRCCTTATPRSAAGRAPAASRRARTRAAAAGPAPARPSAASTSEPHPTTAPPSRQRRRRPGTTRGGPSHDRSRPGGPRPRQPRPPLGPDDQGPRRRGPRRCAPTCASSRRSSSWPSRPSRRSSTGSCKAGYDEIVVVPLLLTEAYHAKVDVPARDRRGHRTARGPRDPRHRACSAWSRCSSRCSTVGCARRSATPGSASSTRWCSPRPAPRTSSPTRPSPGSPGCGAPGTSCPPSRRSPRPLRPATGEAVRAVPGRGPPPHRGRLAVPGAGLPAGPGRRAGPRGRRGRRVGAARRRPGGGPDDPGALRRRRRGARPGLTASGACC